MTDEHKFIITSLDMHTIDLEPFQYSGANITGFRLVSPEDPFVKNITETFREMYLRKNPREEPQDRQDETEELPNELDLQIREEIPDGLTAEKLLLDTALTYDAVMLFAQVMSQHRGVHSDGVVCDDRESIFVNGTSIFNSMKTITFKGLSGDVQFDQQGNRENFQLELLELASDGLKKVGTWNSTKGIQSIRGKTIESSQTDGDVLRNKTLLVLTVIVS